jgi:toxin ParE1/3/4
VIGRRVVTSRRADEDITSAIDYYAGEARPDAAVAFVDELEAAFGLVGEHPSIGSTRFAVETGIAELRSIALRRFPYLVFYVESGDVVRVVRVLHTHRDLPTELQAEP